MLAVHAIMSGVGYNRSMDRAAVTTAIERKTGIRGGIRGHRSAARKGRLIFPSGGFFLDLRHAGGATAARNGAAGKNRTFDPALTKGVLYP